MENSTDTGPQKSTNWVWTDVGITDLAGFFLKVVVALIPVSIIVSGVVFALAAVIHSIDR